MKNLTFETFSELGDYQVSSLKKETPSAFNGFVEVEKYRVTIEKIVEPKEVYAERLQKLWEECDNYHHWDPLKSKAKELGVELIGTQGAKRKKK